MKLADLNALVFVNLPLINLPRFEISESVYAGTGKR